MESASSGRAQCRAADAAGGRAGLEADGVQPSDMEFQKTKEAAAREIAMAFGVPPMLMGIPGDATYANYQEANRAFYRLTVLPLVGAGDGGDVALAVGVYRRGGGVAARSGSGAGAGGRARSAVGAGRGGGFPDARPKSARCWACRGWRRTNDARATRRAGRAFSTTVSMRRRHGSRRTSGWPRNVGRRWSTGWGRSRRRWSGWKSASGWGFTGWRPFCWRRWREALI